MDYLQGYKDATEVLIDTTNSVANAIVTEENTDKAFLITQLDKFFAISYLLKFNAERMMDESCKDAMECEGQREISDVLDDIFKESLSKMKKNKRSGD